MFDDISERNKNIRAIYETAIMLKEINIPSYILKEVAIVLHKEIDKENYTETNQIKQIISDILDG